MTNHPATERKAGKVYARGGSQTLRLRFSPEKLALIDRVRSAVRDKLGLNVSRPAVMSMGLAALMADLAELRGVDVEAVAASVLREFR